MAVASAFRMRGCSAMRATSSSTTAFSTALCGVGPQAKGPCPATSTPGTAPGSMPRSRKHSTITAPVLCSYASRISSSRIRRVAGTGP
jgi:hypothetical protein